MLPVGIKNKGVKAKGGALEFLGAEEVKERRKQKRVI